MYGQQQQKTGQCKKTVNNVQRQWWAKFVNHMCIICHWVLINCPERSWSQKGKNMATSCCTGRQHSEKNQCLQFVFITSLHVQRSLRFKTLAVTGETASHFWTFSRSHDFPSFLASGIFPVYHTRSWGAAAVAQIAPMCRMSPECWVRKPPHERHPKFQTPASLRAPSAAAVNSSLTPTTLDHGCLTQQDPHKKWLNEFSPLWQICLNSRSLCVNLDTCSIL